ncbi:MAG: SRPBCC family protein [Desulfobacterales bacterium]
MTPKQFKKSSQVNAPVEAVFKWHARPGAIERLSPPWDPLEIISRTGGIETGAEVKMRLFAGPVPVKWHARHVAFRENEMFQDIQVKGPFSRWIHTHRFEPCGRAPPGWKMKLNSPFPCIPWGQPCWRLLWKKPWNVFLPTATIPLLRILRPTRQLACMVRKPF